MKAKKKEKRGKRRLRRVAVLPSLVTLLNAVCGFAAIHFTARGMTDPDGLWLKAPHELTYFAAAGWMIFLAMVADGVDGFLARMTKGTSGFGGQLDSIADMVSFGVAPAFLMLRVVESSLVESGLNETIGPVSPIFGGIAGKLLWLTAVVYVCCAALRLARFNVEHEAHESAHLSFSGLPTPGAAGVIASLVLLFGELALVKETYKADYIIGAADILSQVIIYLLPLITVIIGLLMVSRRPYAHLINRYVKGRRPLGYVVRAVFLVIFLIWKPEITLTIAFVAYAGSSGVRWVWQNYISRHPAGADKGNLSKPQEPVTGPEDL
jgi:CDP-diacylglycerol--serine O-phosphatidyltransferase